MPQFSGTAHTGYSRTKGGQDRSWIDPRAKIGTAKLKNSYDNRYRVVTKPDPTERTGGYDTLKLVGEIIGQTRKERQVVYSPYTMPTLLRASEHIRASNERQITIGRGQIEELLAASAAMKQWLGQTPESLGLMSARLRLMSGKLLRASTALRLRAGQRIQAYEDFLDSLDRPNPMISEIQFRLAARALAEQVEINVGHAQAALQRIAVAKSLWDEALLELQEAIMLTSADDVEGALRPLRIKPFYFAVNYLDSCGMFGLSSDTIRSAFVAELMFVEMELVLSELKHRPRRIEEIPLADFAAALPDIGFDTPYQHVSSTLVKSYEDMASAFARQDFAQVAALAEHAQNKLRYRGGSTHLHRWHHATLGLQTA